jgi:hypothetical protein
MAAPTVATAPVVNFGTLSISDLLRVNNTAVIDFGRQDVFRVIREFFAASNQIVNEQLALFSERTTERAVGVGAPVTTVVTFTDEFGVPDALKVSGAAQMGFPLQKHTLSRQWTYQWMRKHTPQEMAAQAQAAAVADVLGVQYSLRKAIFQPVNYNHVDRLYDYMVLFVKAFANADGFPIPASPNGQVFNPNTHTHYMGTVNTFPSPDDLVALTRNVREHYSTGRLVLFVEEAFGDYMNNNRLTTYTDFVPLIYPDINYATTQTFARATIEPNNAANRQIGLFQGAEVWVKPWIPANTAFAFMQGARKPVAMRIPNDMGGDNGDFRAIFDDDQYPNECEVLEREYGFGVQDRVSGAVMSYGGGTPSATYTTPAINPPAFG